jgi:hypothetical protein
VVATTTMLNSTPDALAQTPSSPGTEKKDIFKVIMTEQGLKKKLLALFTAELAYM